MRSFFNQFYSFFFQVSLLADKFDGMEKGKNKREAMRIYRLYHHRLGDYLGMLDQLRLAAGAYQKDSDIYFRDIDGAKKIIDVPGLVLTPNHLSYKDYGLVPVPYVVRDGLEEIANIFYEYGVKWHITCGYAVFRSDMRIFKKHSKGLAVDITCDDTLHAARLLEKYLKGFNIMLEVYKGYIHIGFYGKRGVVVSDNTGAVNDAIKAATSCADRVFTA